MKKKLTLNKKSLKNLKLKLKKVSDRKLAPFTAVAMAPSNGESC